MPDVRMQQVPAGMKIYIHSYLSDINGCGAVRQIIPSFILNNYNDDKYGCYWSHNLTNFVRDVNFYNTFTFVVFQRPASINHLNWIRYFKNNIQPFINCPVLADLDDYYFDIPDYNYAKSYFDQCLEQTKQTLQLVDGLVASTNVLAAKLTEYNRNIGIAPNMLPKALWGEPEFRGRENDGRRLKIFYPCSANHFPTRELYKQGVEYGDIGPTLMKFIRDTVDQYEWVLGGNYPVQLSDLVTTERITLQPWQSPHDYPSTCKSLQADILIAPLKMSRFNECKSNIKMLEAVSMGVPGVYTHIVPYFDATMKAVDEDEFIDHIRYLADSVNNRQDVWEQDHKMVRDGLFFEENKNGLKYINGYLNALQREFDFTPPESEELGEPFSISGGVPLKAECEVQLIEPEV